MVKVEIFLNDTFGGSFRDDLYDSHARADAYDQVRSAVASGSNLQEITARSRERRPFDGYEHGDIVAKSILEFERGEADTDYMALAWHAVSAANRDNRLNGRFERSFSTGDTLRVTIIDHNGSTVKWLVSTGTELLEIDTPTEVLG